MRKEIFLTGITTTGTPHLGNYVGAIRPCIEASRSANTTGFFFSGGLPFIDQVPGPVSNQTFNHGSGGGMAGARP